MSKSQNYKSVKKILEPFKDKIGYTEAIQAFTMYSLELANPCKKFENSSYLLNGYLWEVALRLVIRGADPEIVKKLKFTENGNINKYDNYTPELALRALTTEYTSENRNISKESYLELSEHFINNIQKENLSTAVENAMNYVEGNKNFADHKAREKNDAIMGGVGAAIFMAAATLTFVFSAGAAGLIILGLILLIPAIPIANFAINKLSSFREFAKREQDVPEVRVKLQEFCQKRENTLKTAEQELNSLETAGSRNKQHDSVYPNNGRPSSTLNPRGTSDISSGEPSQNL